MLSDIMFNVEGEIQLIDFGGEVRLSESMQKLVWD